MKLKTLENLSDEMLELEQKESERYSELYGKLANQMDGCGGIAADGLNICIGNGFYGNFIFDFTSRRG